VGCSAAVDQHADYIICTLEHVCVAVNYHRERRHANMPHAFDHALPGLLVTLHERDQVIAEDISDFQSAVVGTGKPPFSSRTAHYKNEYRIEVYSETS
jgi:hypothetical protein